MSRVRIAPGIGWTWTLPVRLLLALGVAGALLACGRDGGRNRGPTIAGADTAAYEAALNIADPGPRRERFEDFLDEYPQSPLRGLVYRRLFELRVVDDESPDVDRFLKDALRKEKLPETRAALHYALFEHVGREATGDVQATVNAILDDKAPLGSDLYNAVAWDLAEADRELDLALQLAERAVATAPDSMMRATALDTRGWVHYHRREFPAAIADLESAAAGLHGSVPEIQDHLARAYDAGGKLAEARKLYLDLLVTQEIPEFRRRVEGITRDLGESVPKVMAELDAKRAQRTIAAPDFTLTDYKGKPVRLSALRGDVVVLNFWHPT